jgi:hypothetical protein
LGLAIGTVAMVKAVRKSVCLSMFTIFRRHVYLPTEIVDHVPAEY